MKEKLSALFSPGTPGRRRFLGLGAAALALPFASRLSAFVPPEALPPDRGPRLLQYPHRGVRGRRILPVGLARPRVARDDQPHPPGHAHRRGQGRRPRPPRSSQCPFPDARDKRALPRHLRLPLGQHQRVPADIRQRRGGGQQPASRRQSHRHPRAGRPSPGPLPGGGRTARRRRGDLPRIGFRPRRRRPRPDLVGRPTGGTPRRAHPRP